MRESYIAFTPNQTNAKPFNGTAVPSKNLYKPVCYTLCLSLIPIGADIYGGNALIQKIYLFDDNSLAREGGKVKGRERSKRRNSIFVNSLPNKITALIKHSVSKKNGCFGDQSK